MSWIQFWGWIINTLLLEFHIRVPEVSFSLFQNFPALKIFWTIDTTFFKNLNQKYVVHSNQYPGNLITAIQLLLHNSTWWKMFYCWFRSLKKVGFHSQFFWVYIIFTNFRVFRSFRLLFFIEKKKKLWEINFY